jgi:hypothetical protein
MNGEQFPGQPEGQININHHLVDIWWLAIQPFGRPGVWLLKISRLVFKASAVAKS